MPVLDAQIRIGDEFTEILWCLESASSAISAVESKDEPLLSVDS